MVEADSCFPQVADKRRGGKSEDIQDQVVEDMSKEGQVLAVVKGQVSSKEEHSVDLVSHGQAAGLAV